jgi:transcriptional regulator with XRE-family HTH domain
MTRIESDICFRIYCRRKHLKIPRQDLANKLGVHYETVRQWESSICSPRLNKIEELAKHLGSSVEYLLVGHSSTLDNKS